LTADIEALRDALLAILRGFQPLSANVIDREPTQGRCSERGTDRFLSAP
jgi:hypothetical protein